jgi:hypothetical protein
LKHTRAKRSILQYKAHFKRFKPLYKINRVLH